MRLPKEKNAKIFKKHTFSAFTSNAFHVVHSQVNLRWVCAGVPIQVTW